jgi:DNA helicase-2/ATP-dependent DNA helicase PcrA
VAGPGTGKTQSIVDSIERLLESGVKGEEIGCTTFTNKAAEMMGARLLKISEKDPQKRDQVSRIQVGTVHSLSIQLDQDDESSPDIVPTEILRMIIYREFRKLKTFDYSDSYIVENLIPRAENALRYIKSYGILPEDIDERKTLQFMNDSQTGSSKLSPEQMERLVHDFIHVYREYEMFKNESEGRMDYNDILFRAMKSPLKKFRYLFVDEFQDLSRLQVAIIERMGEKIYCVGDRKQSIFGFQGGSLHSFRSYLKSSSFEKKELIEHHRCTPEILAYASEYLSGNTEESDLIDEINSLVCLNDHGEKVRVIATDDTIALASDIARRFKEDARPGTLGILARSNSTVYEISQRLREMKIDHFSSVSAGQESGASSEIISFLKGLAYATPQTVSEAILTPFSGLSLGKASEIIRSLEKNPDLSIIPDSLFRTLLSRNNGVEVLQEAFEKLIIPASISLGQPYYNCAVKYRDLTSQFISDLGSMSVDDYFTFLRLASMDSEVDPAIMTINVMTVHKAKGLEFDSVLYVPSNPASQSYFDRLATAIVYSSTGIDVEKDLREEGLRIDYVAFTRAKKELTVLCRDQKMLTKYSLGNSEVSIVESEPVKPSRDIPETRNQEAYMLFLNGKYEEAKQALAPARESWIAKAIRSYFKNLTRISYSLISGLEDPMDFLKNRILNLGVKGERVNLGLEFHQLVSRYKDGIVPDKVSIEIDHMLTNYRMILGQITSMGYSQLPNATEVSFQVMLEDILPGSNPERNITVTGAMDAIFKSKSDDSLLVIDYKTSRSEANNSEYFQQLYFYAKVIGAMEEWKSSKVTVGVAYVNLQDGISTGSPPKFDLKVRDGKKITTDRTPSRIKSLMEYIDKPELFIENVLASADMRDSLDRRIVSDLST